MEFRTCDHRKEAGVYCDLPALRGRKYCYFRPNLRQRRQNFANPARKSLRLNILPASLTGSIFCPDFRLSPPVFSRFYEYRGGGGRAPIEAFHAQHSAIGARHWLAWNIPVAYDCDHPPTVLKGLHP